MIGPSLAGLLDHFGDAEFIFLAEELTSSTSARLPMVLGAGRKSLKQSRLGYVRIGGTGRALESNQDKELKGLLILNVLRGSGGTLPGFVGMVIDSARNLGIAFVLHRPRGGPVRMIDTNTGLSAGIYHGLPDAISPYFSRLLDSAFHVHQLDRALSRLKSARSMIGMAAEMDGEMMRVTDFTPVRFSQELEERVRLLRSQRTEFGFVSARMAAEKPMIEALKKNAAAMGMEWHELNFIPYCPGDPEHGSSIGLPFLLLTMQNRRLDLMDRLNDLAVQHRQDHVLRVYRDRAIELVAPYHNTVTESFTHLPAAVRAFAEGIMRTVPIPILEVWVASAIASSESPCLI